MSSNFTTRRERYNLYTTIHEGWSARMGWLSPDGFEWQHDPDRITLLPEKTLTQDNSLERLKKDYGGVVGFQVFMAYLKGSPPSPETGLVKRRKL